MIAPVEGALAALWLLLLAGLLLTVLVLVSMVAMLLRDAW
jgi:hypothetical protein